MVSRWTADARLDPRGKSKPSFQSTSGLETRDAAMLDIEFSHGVQPCAGRRRPDKRTWSSGSRGCVVRIVRQRVDAAARPAALRVGLGVGERLDPGRVLRLNEGVDVTHILAALLLGPFVPVEEAAYPPHHCVIRPVYLLGATEGVLVNLHPVVARVIPNIFVTYRVKDGYAEIVNIWGTMSGSVCMSDASIRIDGGGPLQLWVGKLTITGRNADTLIWNNVPRAKTVREQLRALAKPMSDAKSPSPEPYCDPVPAGTKFSSKVVVVPGYASGFTHSGNVQSLMQGQNYRWVNRGDAIGEFRLHGSLDDSSLSRLLCSKTHSATIRAPVSGLLLHSTLSHDFSDTLSNWNAMKQAPVASFSILLPANEPAPESGEYVYSAMCRLASDMKHYYLKDSRYWSMAAFTSESFDELVKLQTTAQPRIFDVLPAWSDYLGEAHTLKPELRPLIQHLLTQASPSQ